MGGEHTEECRGERVLGLRVGSRKTAASFPFLEAFKKLANSGSLGG